MNCKRAKQELALSAGNDLDPMTEQELRRHLNECPECQNRWNRLRTTTAVLQRAAAEDVVNSWERLGSPGCRRLFVSGGGLDSTVPGTIHESAERGRFQYSRGGFRQHSTGVQRSSGSARLRTSKLATVTRSGLLRTRSRITDRMVSTISRFPIFPTRTSGREW